MLEAPEPQQPSKKDDRRASIARYLCSSATPQVPSYRCILFMGQASQTARPVVACQMSLAANKARFLVRSMLLMDSLGMAQLSLPSFPPQSSLVLQHSRRHSRVRHKT